MGAVVDLRGNPMPLDSNLGLELVEDLARFAEGILDEATIRKRYRFADEDWEKLGANDGLVEAIEARKTQRIRTGLSAKEKAQVLFASTPEVLGTILNDTNTSPRHRIESAREIRAIAATGPEATPASDRFVITINLGDDHVETFNKSRTITVDDPDDVTPAPQGLLAAIAAKKPEGGGNGEPL
jgi:hypothetical protein